MDTTDVYLNAGRAQERVTTHFFEFRESLERQAGPSGSAVRLPSDMSIWPPAALFDAVYASTVVHHFGVALGVILEKWGDVFYPGGPTKPAYADDRRRHGQADGDRESSTKQKIAREQHHERHTSNRERGIRYAEPCDLVMMYRCQAMDPEEVRAYLRGCEEMAAARERKGLEEKVNYWRESLKPLTANDIW